MLAMKHRYSLLILTLGKTWIIQRIRSVLNEPLMHRRCGSTRGYVHSKDLEQDVRRSDGVAKHMLQPPLQLIPSFRWPRAFSACFDCPETWQECRAQVVRRAHSELEHVVAQIAPNNTKTTLVVFKSLTARADILELYKQLP